MSRYSGTVLSLITICICLWINICHYPVVREMVGGQTNPASEKGAGSADDTDTLETNAVPADEEPFYARIAVSEGNWPKPVVISANSPDEGLSENDPADEDPSVFRQVSFTADQCSAEAVSEAVRTEEPAAAPSDVISDIAEGGIRVHSSYLAAEFSEASSPLDFDTPSYEIEQETSGK